MEYLLVLMFYCLMYAQCEPECSRFHYEQMTLEKMIRQELNVDKMLGEYRDELQRMKTDFGSLRSETENYKIELGQVKEMKEKMREEYDEQFRRMEKEISKLKNETNKHQSALDEVKAVKQTAPVVIFHAKTLKNKSPSDGERLVFTDAMSNVGSGYSTSDGRFTAPVNGTYAFMVQLCISAGPGYIQYRVVKSTGDVLLQSQLGNPGPTYYDCDAEGVFEILKAGESVWIEQSGKSGIKEYVDHASLYWNYFSGVLLKEK